MKTNLPISLKFYGCPYELNMKDLKLLFEKVRSCFIQQGKAKYFLFSYLIMFYSLISDQPNRTQIEKQKKKL